MFTNLNKIMELSKADKILIKELAKNYKKDRLATSFYISIQEASIILRMHQQEVIKLIQYEALKAIKTNKSIKILVSSINELQEKLTHSDFPENFKDKRILDIFRPYEFT